LETVGALSEEEVIALIAGKLLSKTGIGEHLSHPDDARDVIPRAPKILFSMDAYTVNSLKLPWRGYSDVGWSALTGAISDIVAKGGVPHACMVALGIPPELDLKLLDEFISGMKEASEYYKVRVLGGDTNRSAEMWVAISVLGFTTARTPPSRRGLKPGDAIVVTGIYGPMGYVVKHGFEKALNEKWVVDFTKRPRAYLEVGYIIENYYKAVTASMDVSDGLGYTLQTMAILSSCGIAVRDPPQTPQQLVDLCRGGSDCLLEYALLGGEEYGVVFGVKPEWLRTVLRDLEHFNVPFTVIGEAVEAGEPGLYVNGRRFRAARYDQFREWA